MPEDEFKVTVPLRRPSLLSMQLLLSLAGACLGLLAGTLPRPAGASLHTMLIFAVFIPAVAVVHGARVAYARWNGGAMSLSVGMKCMTLPSNALSRRMICVPLERIRSIVLLGAGPTARVVVDAGRRVFAYPLRAFERADAVAELRAAVQHGLSLHVDSAAMVSAMHARHALADIARFRRPVLTWIVLGLICAVFAGQLLTCRTEDVFGLVDLGANAPLLVWSGQWFRLITANLLHATSQHLLGNGASLLVIGAMVERLAGWRHCLILLVGTCVVSQLASAAAGSWPGGHLYSVGISGGIFGLLGAFAAITWRFGAGLPGGLRLPTRAWILLAVINGGLFPLLVPQIDIWAHVGGAASGALLGWLLCHGRTEVSALRKARTLTRDAAAALLLVVGAGIGADVLHGTSANATLGDRLLLIEAVRQQPAYNGDVRNALAWSVALEPLVSPPLLDQAMALANQAVTQLRAFVPRPGVTPKRLPANQVRQATVRLANAMDTVAVLQARSGHLPDAVDTEALLLGGGEPYGTHMSLFLDRLLRGDGARLRGSGPAAPRIVLDHGIIRLSLDQPVEHGARIYAVLHDSSGLAGMLFFRLPPGFAGEQILPLPTAMAAPSNVPPDPIWTAASTRIDVAMFDRRGCFCERPWMGPYYHPVDTAAAVPP